MQEVIVTSMNAARSGKRRVNVCGKFGLSTRVETNNLLFIIFSIIWKTDPLLNLTFSRSI